MDMTKIIKRYVQNSDIKNLNKLLKDYSCDDLVCYYVGYYGNTNLLWSSSLKLKNKQKIIEGALNSKFGNLFVITYIEKYGNITINWQDLANSAAKKGKIHVVQYATKKFENNKYTLYPIVLNALINKHNDIVKYILEKEKFDKNTINELLNIAFKRGNVNAIKYISMLDLEENINSPDIPVQKITETQAV